MTIEELAGTLRGLAVTLEQTGLLAAGATPTLEQAKAQLLRARRADDGWYPVELDQAMAELGRAVEAVAHAQQLIADYLMRL